MFPITYDSTQMRAFESQYKYLPPMPEGLKLSKDEVSIKSEEKMDVDEIAGKHIKVYTFDSYFAEHD